jgi:hypothetical protein
MSRNFCGFGIIVAKYFIVLMVSALVGMQSLLLVPKQVMVHSPKARSYSLDEISGMDLPAVMALLIS